MREVSQVSKRISTARHRATPEKGATLEAMTQVMGRSGRQAAVIAAASGMVLAATPAANAAPVQTDRETRSEEHTSELQSRGHLVCRLLLEKKKITEEQRHS